MLNKFCLVLNDHSAVQITDTSKTALSIIKFLFGVNPPEVVLSTIFPGLVIITSFQLKSECQFSPVPQHKFDSKLLVWPTHVH